jgi:hypothetical protein
MMVESSKPMSEMTEGQYSPCDDTTHVKDHMIHDHGASRQGTYSCPGA